MHKLNTTFFIYSIFYFKLRFSNESLSELGWLISEAGHYSRTGWFVSTNSLFSPKACFPIDWLASEPAVYFPTGLFFFSEPSRLV